MPLIDELTHLRIPFEDIKEATNNFTTLIGRGGYGPVYRGQLVSITGQLTVVAVKRLQIDNRSGQGLKEFLTEIQLLSRYKHPNLVSLVGFCEHGNEKFLIYNHAQHGSLDRYLKPHKSSCPLTWRQRIKICVDAARGLDHLHNHVAQNQRVIHRDIKSANILVHHDWKAMVADFGLSKIGRANEMDTYLITNASGTHGYCDPAYIHTGILTKKSDVYSFGVVLLEVVCGRLCFINVDSKERFLAPLAQTYYKQNKIDLIVDRDLKKHMCSDSMKEFLEIAFQCINDDRQQRPWMGLVLQKLEKALELLEMEEAPELKELEEALQLQKLVETLQLEQLEEARELQELEEFMELNKLVEMLQIQQFEDACEMQELEEALGLPQLMEALKLHEFEEALKLQIGESGYEVLQAAYEMLDIPLALNTFWSHLTSGILVDEGRLWLLMDNDGKTQEMISTHKLGYSFFSISEPESRFSKAAKLNFQFFNKHFKIRTQFLACAVSHIRYAYAAFLVCKPKSPADLRIWHRNSLRYRLGSTDEEFISYPSKVKDSGWWMFELFQIHGDKRIADFEVTLEIHEDRDNPWSSLLIEGIKFMPLSPQKVSSMLGVTTAGEFQSSSGHETDTIQWQVENEDKIEKSELDELSTPNINWDDRLPSDYKKFIYYSNKKMMKKPLADVIFPSKEEAYLLLSTGVPIKIDGIKMLFWITKLNGKKCIILPSKYITFDTRGYYRPTPSSESRINNVIYVPYCPEVVSILFKVPYGVLSKNTTYGMYLVYKIREYGNSSRNVVVIMSVENRKVPVEDKRRGWPVCLNKLQIPVYVDGTVSDYTHPANKTIEWATERKDGWMEVRIQNISDIQLSWKRKETRESCFFSCVSDQEDDDTDNGFTLHPRYFSYFIITIWNPDNAGSLDLIVEGMELRPI